MPEFFGASSIALALSKDEATVRGSASMLPMSARPQRCVARAFSVGDAVAIVLVDDLVGAGLPKRVAFAIASAVSPDLVRVVADVDYAPWITARPDDTAPLGFAWALVPTAHDALAATLEAPMTLVCDLEALVSRAMERLLVAKRAAKSEAAVDA